MEDNQDLSTGKLADLKAQADQAVSQNEDGSFVIKFDKEIEGLDPDKTYASRPQAIDAAFSALKKQPDNQKKAG